METKLSKPKSTGVMNGGARIVVEDDDEVLRYGGEIFSTDITIWLFVENILTTAKWQVFMPVPCVLFLFHQVPLTCQRC